MPMPSLEPKGSKKVVDQSRQIAIQAAVVRIMKARKRMSHAALVGEVLGQISLFHPDPRQIKRAIEDLIEREDMEREEDDARMYRYLS